MHFLKENNNLNFPVNYSYISLENWKCGKILSYINQSKSLNTYLLRQNQIVRAYIPVLNLVVQAL